MQTVTWKIKQLKAQSNFLEQHILFQHNNTFSHNIYFFFYSDYKTAYSVSEGDIEGGM